MRSNTSMGCLEFVVTKMFPITISTISLLLSSFNLYIDYLKSPDISFTIAQFISHGVDHQSFNESFFIPLTVVNRGARPGTVVSFDLTVTHLPSQKQATYSSQYYAKDNDFTLIGDYFSPLSLHGYSTASQTVVFYPVGFRQGNLLAATGTYQFDVEAAVANVRSQSQKAIVQTFFIELTDEMVADMQENGKYPYPMKIEPSNQ